MGQRADQADRGAGRDGDEHAGDRIEPVRPGQGVLVIRSHGYQYKYPVPHIGA